MAYDWLLVYYIPFQSILLYYTALPEVVRAVRAAHGTQRPEWSEWPATYYSYTVPFYTYTLYICLYVAMPMPPHPHNRLLYPYLHVSPFHSRG